MHENSSTNVNVSAIVQATPGRVCGNNKRRGADAPRIYYNVKAIETYVNWFKNGCKYPFSGYKSSNIKASTVSSVVKAKTPFNAMTVLKDSE